MPSIIYGGFVTTVVEGEVEIFTYIKELWSYIYIINEPHTVPEIAKRWKCNHSHTKKQYITVHSDPYKEKKVDPKLPVPVTRK